MFERRVAGTSTEDVRESAGTSNSQLYRYVGDKNELVGAVVVYHTQQDLDAQQTLLGQLDSFDALKAWRELLIDLQRQPGCRGGCPIGSLASELADVDEGARKLLVPGFARWESAIRKSLASMRDRGELRPDADPDHLALVTLTASRAACCSPTPGRDVAPLHAGLTAVIAYIPKPRHLSRLNGEDPLARPIASPGAPDHATRVRSGRRSAAAAGRPGVELSELGVDLHRDRAVEVAAVRVRRGDAAQQLHDEDVPSAVACSQRPTVVISLYENASPLP